MKTAKIIFYGWIIAMISGATITSMGFFQKAYAPSPAFCTSYIEDGQTINACFSGPDAHKNCKSFANDEQLFGSKCVQIKKFEF